MRIIKAYKFRHYSNDNQDIGLFWFIYDYLDKKQRQYKKNNAETVVSQQIQQDGKKNYVSEQSDNEKIKSLRLSVINEGLGNSEQTQSLINTIEKVIEDKNYNVIFDSSITNSQGNFVNAQINTNDNGEVDIRINPNSDRTFEFLLVHEITHAIETNQMKKLVMGYAKKNAKLEQALQELQNTYGTKDVSDEVLADISGQLFGNQEFINSLSMKRPYILKKIYDKMIEFANKITGNSKMVLFTQDLKNKWRRAYREQNNNLDTTHFSKGKLLDGQDVVVSDDLLGNKPSEKQAKQVLVNMLGIKYNNKSSGNLLSIENKDINKFLHDGYKDYKNSRLKKRVAGNYGEILEIAKIKTNLPVANYKGTNRGKNGFDYYGVNLAYPIKDSTGSINDYKYYHARLVVRKEPNGNFAYDLDNFKEKKGIALDKTSLSITADKSASNSFLDNNISNSNKNVKSDISTKYSM